MGSGKQSDSEISSEEIDQPDKVAATGTGRYYECNFCKRGFTNAQALGGHMNIHRKDKDKAKHKIHSETTLLSANKSHEDYYNTTKYFSLFSSTLGAYNMGNQVYFPASNNPSYLNCYNYRYDQLPSPPRRPDHDLRLRIGPPLDMEDDDEEERSNNRNESNIDLELRLGYHP